VLSRGRQGRSRRGWVEWAFMAARPNGLGSVLAIEEPLLNNPRSVGDLVGWRDEVVRLEQRRDDGIRPLGDLAELLAAGGEAGRSAARAGRGMGVAPGGRNHPGSDTAANSRRRPIRTGSPPA
jgi:hypothetical protein